MNEMKTKALQFAKCKPNLQFYRAGTKFDVFVCNECNKLWSIRK